MGLAFSAISKYIELVTSAGAEVGKSVGMVLEVGDQVVQALGIEDRLDKMEEWPKALAFLSSDSGKDDHFHHFAESFVVLLINQERIPLETDCAGLQCDQGAAGDDAVPHLRQL